VTKSQPVFRLLPLAQMRRQKPAGIVCVLCWVATNAIILDIVESLGIRCFDNLATVFFKHLMGLRESMFRFVDSVPTLGDFRIRQQIAQHLQQPWSVGP
jgi:hypothetical protein